MKNKSTVIAVRLKTDSKRMLDELQEVSNYNKSIKDIIQLGIKLCYKQYITNAKKNDLELVQDAKELLESYLNKLSVDEKKNENSELMEKD